MQGKCIIIVYICTINNLFLSKNRQNWAHSHWK